VKKHTFTGRRNKHNDERQKRFLDFQLEIIKLFFQTFFFHSKPFCFIFRNKGWQKFSNTKIFRKFFAEKFFPALRRLPPCMPGRFHPPAKTPQGILHTPFRAKHTLPAG